MSPSTPSQNYQEIFHPKHPHRKIHILFSILAFIVVIGSITFYQLNKSKGPEQAPGDSGGVTQAEMDKIVEMSKGFNAQEQTPQMRAKLDEVTKSFNQNN